LFVKYQKALAPAMSDETETRKALELMSAVRQGFTPDAVPIEGRRRNGSNRRTQLTQINSEKADGANATGLLDCNTADPETTNKLVSGQFEALWT
jgi:hypothetical protein